MQGSSDPNPELLDAAALCRHLIDPKSVAALLADRRHELFPDELFGDLFPSGRGRPSVPADVIASVMVLQSLEGLSDRHAAGSCVPHRVEGCLRPAVGRRWNPRHGADAVAESLADLGAAAADLRCGAAPGGGIGRDRHAPASGAGFHRARRGDATGHADAAHRTDPGGAAVDPEARALELRAHNYEQGGAKPACAWNDPADIDRVVTELVTDAEAVLNVVQGLELSAVLREQARRRSSAC